MILQIHDIKTIPLMPETEDSNCYVVLSLNGVFVGKDNIIPMRITSPIIGRMQAETRHHVRELDFTFGDEISSSNSFMARRIVVMEQEKASVVTEACGSFTC